MNIENPLRRSQKRSLKEEYECESCQRIIYGGSACVSKHLHGSRHMKLMHVYYLSDFLNSFIQIRM